MRGDILSRAWPGAQWSWPREDDYDTLEWLGPGEKPSVAEIDAATTSFMESRLASHAAGKRWECEVGGTMWNGWPVHTDRESQGKIVAERLAIEAGVRDDPDGWKFADGQFRMISNADFVALANAVLDHVRQCFATEAMVLAAIAGGQITTTEEIESQFVEPEDAGIV